MELTNQDKSKILDLLKRYGIYIAGVILLLLLIRQCNATADAEKDAKRQYNNLLASQDSVRFISNKLGNAVYEKSAFELKMSELSKENKDLIDKLDLDKKRTPEVVIQTITKYVEVVKEVPTKIIEDSLGNKSISFLHNPKLPGANSLRIEGKTPIQINVDKDPSHPNDFRPRISAGSTEIKIEQSISIVTGLYRDPKTKRLMTRVSTDYPGITFTDINSFQIQDTPENRKALMSERKRFGLGLSAGFGYVVGKGGFSPGAFIGLGVNLSPKILQFDTK
jgi:hypothetical protein